jgi:hypothetical protein
MAKESRSGCEGRSSGAVSPARRGTVFHDALDDPTTIGACTTVRVRGTLKKTTQRSSRGIYQRPWMYFGGFTGLVEINSGERFPDHSIRRTRALDRDLHGGRGDHRR